MNEYLYHVWWNHMIHMINVFLGNMLKYFQVLSICTTFTICSESVVMIYTRIVIFLVPTLGVWGRKAPQLRPLHKVSNINIKVYTLTDKYTQVYFILKTLTITSKHLLLLQNTYYYTGSKLYSLNQLLYNSIT